MEKWIDHFKWKKIVLNLLRLTLVVFIVCMALVIGINVTAVQSYLAGRVIKGIRDKSGTTIRLQSVEIALPNSVQINDLYIQDQMGDTLLCMKSLKVKIGLFGLLRNEISINQAELNNAVINVSRKDTAKGFNYQYLVDLFVRKDQTPLPDSLANQTTPWLFNVEQIHLNQVRLKFTDRPSGVDFKIGLEKFQTVFDKVDLAKRDISIRKFLLKNATAEIALSDSSNNQDSFPAPKKPDEPLQGGEAERYSPITFPGWNIAVRQFLLEETNLRFDQNGAPKREKGLDFRHFSLHKLNAGLRDFQLSRQGVKTTIDQVNCEEDGGFKLARLAGVIAFDKEKAELEDFLLATSSSEIGGGAKIEYSGLEQLTADIGNCIVSVELKKMKVATADVLYFVPDWSKNRYLQALGSSGLSLTASVNGRINDLTIGNIDLSLLKDSRFQAHGKVKGLPDYRKAELDATIDLLTTSKNELFLLAGITAIQGLNLPPSLAITGHAKGTIGSFSADAALASAYGNINADVLYHRRTATSRDSFMVGFTIKDLEAGSLTGNALAGKITASGRVIGSGVDFALPTLSCSAGLTIAEAAYNNHPYSNIILNGSIRNGKVVVDAISDNPGLKFKLAGEANLNGPRKRISTIVDLLNIDLQALHLTETKQEIGTNLSWQLDYSDRFTAETTLELKNSQLRSEGKTIPVRVFHCYAMAATDSLNFHAKTDLAEVNLSGKVNPKDLAKIYLSAYRKYLSLPGDQANYPGTNLRFQAIINKQNNLREYIPQLVKLEVAKLEASYSGTNNQFEMVADLPQLVYGKIRLDSLQLAVSGKNEAVSLDLALAKIAYDSLQIKHIGISEKVAGGMVHSTIQINDALGKPRYLFANEIGYESNAYKISFLPNGLILDGMPWKTLPGNQIQNLAGELLTRQFVFTNGKQSIELVAQDQLQKLRFSAFELKSVANLVSYQGKGNLINGLMSGEIAFSSNDHLPLVNADFKVDQLALLDSVMGMLTCDLQLTQDKLEVMTKLEDKQNNIAVTGQIDHLASKPLLDLKAMLRISEPLHFEKLTLCYL